MGYQKAVKGKKTVLGVSDKNLASSIKEQFPYDHP